MADIRTISSLQSDPTVYFLTPGGTSNFPAQVRLPVSNGKKLIICRPGDYTKYKEPSDDSFSLKPRESGSAGDPIRIVYWDGVSKVLDLDNIKHPSIQNEKAYFNFIEFHTSGVFNGDYWEGIGLTTPQFHLRTALGSAIRKCRLNSPGAQPTRIRFNCQECEVTDCHYERSWPLITTNDSVAIHLGQSGNNRDIVIRGNTILNYTDAIQAEDYTGFEECPGLIFEDNVCGSVIPPNPDGSMVEGLEQTGGTDMKVGGSVANPAIIRNNFFFGNRPNLSTPGYLHNCHNNATNIKYINNINVNSHCGIFLPAIKDAGNNKIPSNISIEGDQYITMQDTGPGTTYFPEEGEVLVGPHGITMTNVSLLDCKHLAQNQIGGDIGEARTLNNVVIYQDADNPTGILPSYTTGISVINSTFRFVTKKIKFTNYKVRYKKLSSVIAYINDNEVSNFTACLKLNRSSVGKLIGNTFIHNEHDVHMRFKVI